MCFFVTKGITPEGKDADVGGPTTVGQEPSNERQENATWLSTADWNHVLEINDQKTFMKDLGWMLWERIGNNPDNIYLIV